jgi:hypothetical protein
MVGSQMGPMRKTQIFPALVVATEDIDEICVLRKLGRIPRFVESFKPPDAIRSGSFCGRKPGLNRCAKRARSGNKQRED